MTPGPWIISTTPRRIYSAVPGHEVVAVFYAQAGEADAKAAACLPELKAFLAEIWEGHTYQTEEELTQIVLKLQDKAGELRRKAGWEP